jgi:hypothetical protein
MSHCNGSGMCPTGNGGPCDGCQYCKPAPSPQPEMPEEAMTTPTPERIAAALALAEAVDAAAVACDAPEGTPPALFQRTWLARCRALDAYRATAPKLRTRAEVDAERLLNLDAWRAFAISGTELCRRDSLLSAERVQDEY